MQPAIGLQDVRYGLATRYAHQYEDDPSAHARMVGIVFASPNSPLAKAEVIPQLNDWHFRSGRHIDFYFAGYTRSHEDLPGYVKVPVPGQAPWLYSSERYHAFREDLQGRTTWTCTGSAELLLLNARYDRKAGEVVLDFGSMICCQLDAMKADKAIASVERFFEAIFRFAEKANDEDPTWGFSDSQGIAIAGSALKRVVLSLLPKEVDEGYRRAEHFVVRDVGRG